MYKKILLFFTLIISTNIYALSTVEAVDLERYLGKWYEIARLDAWFEKNCVNATAEYTLDKDVIQVVNSCHIHSPSGELKRATGRATVVPDSNNAKLKVSFLPGFLSFLDPLFSGDYWILKLDADYKVVLVGDPSKKYLWILARNKTLDSKTYDEYVHYAKELGFETSKLIKNSANK